jgi:hypothetical protein
MNNDTCATIIVLIIIVAFMSPLFETFSWWPL